MVEYNKFCYVLTVFVYLYCLLILFREIFTVYSEIYTAPLRPPAKIMRVQISLSYIVQRLNVDLAENASTLPMKIALWLTLFTKIIVVCCDNHTDQLSTAELI